jgi:ssDNA-binding replication factor A large subunit
MKIAELNSQSKKVKVTGTVTLKGEPRQVKSKTSDKTYLLSTATLKDGTGSIGLNLWNEYAQKVGKGDKIRIENGYVKEYKGLMVLDAGKYGKLTVIEKVQVPQPEVSEELNQNIFDAFQYHLDQLQNILDDLKKAKQ